jgi:hypothetical protein
MTLIKLIKMTSNSSFVFRPVVIYQAREVLINSVVRNHEDGEAYKQDFYYDAVSIVFRVDGELFRLFPTIVDSVSVWRQIETNNAAPELILKH